MRLQIEGRSDLGYWTRARRSWRDTLVERRHSPLEVERGQSPPFAGHICTVLIGLDAWATSPPSPLAGPLSLVEIMADAW